MERFTKEEATRFNKFIIKSGECEMWTGYCDDDGYGKFFFKKKNRRAHRVSYYFKHGDIPKGMVIDHICKNRSCVNVDHLRLVSQAENTLINSNSLGAINKARTTCKNGHAFDKVYGTIKKQRYCSICENAKSKRLQKKWLKEANQVSC